MNDETRGIIAIAISVLTLIGTATINLLKYRSSSKTENREANRENRKDAIFDADRYRTLYLAELDRALIWERRCRWMDDKAHELMSQIESERQKTNMLLDKLGLQQMIWIDIEPLPKLETL